MENKVVKELSNCTLTTIKQPSGAVIVEVEYSLKDLNSFYKSVGK